MSNTKIGTVDHLGGPSGKINPASDGRQMPFPSAKGAAMPMQGKPKGMSDSNLPLVHKP